MSYASKIMKKIIAFKSNKKEKCLSKSIPIKTPISQRQINLKITLKYKKLLKQAKLRKYLQLLIIKTIK